MFLPQAQHSQIKSMKLIRLSALLLALSVSVGVFALGAAPAYAAESDMDNYLSKVLGVTNSDLSNYSSNYANSIPIDYEKKSDSLYLAIGGTTTSAVHLDNVENGYADQIANHYGFTFNKNFYTANKPSLTAADAVEYINNTRENTFRIPDADLITFHLDAAAFIGSATNGVVEKADVPWENYISDASLLAELNAFRSKMTAEYASEYGQKNAESIAIVLEYMLYESVIYCNKSIDAVKAIRAKNSDAVILLLGLYNPMRGLSFTANGKTINISNMLEDMIDVTNAYLLKKTKDLSKIAFVDISNTKTNGYSNIELNINDSNAVTTQLNDILKAETSQYANQTGHNYICNQVTDAAKAPCKHTHTKIENKKDATCKETGYTGDTVCTDCGKTIKKGSSIAKTAHKFGSWSQSKAPTCTQKGEESRSCSVCGHTEKRSLDAVGHKWDNGTITKQPTCTQKGVKTFTCTACNTTKTESVATVRHNYDAGTVTKEPTCSSEGVKTFVCGDCGKKKTEPIAKLDHTWDTGTETTAPGCESEGETTFACTGCKATKTEPITAVGHTWDAGTETTAPGCESDGVMTYTCSACEKTRTEVIGSNGHNWDDGIVTTQPGCESEGEKTTTCINCGASTTETIWATGHSFGEYSSDNNATCQEDGTKTATCTNCGKKDTVTDANTRKEHVYENGVCTFCSAEEPQQPNNAGWIIGICATVIVIGGGTAGFFLYKKKAVKTVSSDKE